jgi:2-haloacid dehalogenase
MRPWKVLLMSIAPRDRHLAQADRSTKRLFMEEDYPWPPLRLREWSRVHTSLVTDARFIVVQAGLPAELGAELERRWTELFPWPEAGGVLSGLARHLPLAVATNCSDRLARIATDRTGGRFATIVTAENVGFYKPRPEVYPAVLARVGTEPAGTLFVAGSASDVPGAKGIGMPAYWHNRICLRPRNDARPDIMKASLQPLVEYAGVYSGRGA